jgi:hypothetical protein
MNYITLALPAWPQSRGNRACAMRNRKPPTAAPRALPRWRDFG